MKKVKAIVDNLNNERVATLVEKEFKLKDKLQRFEGWHSKENRFIHISYVKEFLKILEDNSFIEATGSIKVVSLDFIKKKAGDLG